MLSHRWVTRVNTLAKVPPLFAMQSITAALSSLGVGHVDMPISSSPNPVDLYRAHLTKWIARITGAEPAVVYSAIQFTQSLNKGDLSLPTPALRLKGSDYVQVAQNIQNEVCSTFRSAPSRSRASSLAQVINATAN